VANSVCLNHPDRQAETRCTTCFKPICGECAIEADAGTFCSEACLNNYDRTRDGVEAFQEREQRAKRRKRIRRVIILIVLIALGVAAYKYFTDNPDKLKKLEEKAGNLRDKAGNMVEEVQKK
jgi:hypothetical protein